MVSLNRVFIAGNLTRDPEIKYTSGGKAVVEMGLAINNVYISQTGERREDTVFVQVEVWGKQAENVKQYLHKGSPALIEGGLRMDSWETKEGEKRSRLKITASRVQFLGAPRTPRPEGPPEDQGFAPEGNNAMDGRTTQARVSGSGNVSGNVSGNIEEDDIPF